MKVYWFIGTCCVKTKSNLHKTCLRTLGNRDSTIFFLYHNNYFTTKKKEKELKNIHSSTFLFKKLPTFVDQVPFYSFTHNKHT